MAAHLVSALEQAQRGKRLSVGMGRAAGACCERVHNLYRSPLYPPCWRGRCAGCRDHRSARVRHSLPSHSRINVALAERRRAASRFRGGKRKQDFGRIGAGCEHLSRCFARVHAEDCSGTLLAVFRHERIDDSHSGDGRAAGCAASHPHRRNLGRRRLLPPSSRNAPAGTV